MIGYSCFDDPGKTSSFLTTPFFFNMLQIHFVGWSKFSLGPFIAIDDVSFSKEPCEQIPLNPGKGKKY